jgi:DNA invertase Pin-like site-specific DNA recombinase
MYYISANEDMQSQLRNLAQEVVSDIAAADPARSRELLSAFVSELVLAVADESRRDERRQRQAEGIAAAKARGVRFGRPAAPVPDNFDEVHQDWRAGKMSLQQAADACGISRGTFYGIAVRREQSCAG